VAGRARRVGASIPVRPATNTGRAGSDSATETGACEGAKSAISRRFTETRAASARSYMYPGAWRARVDVGAGFSGLGSPQQRRRCLVAQVEARPVAAGAGRGGPSLFFKVAATIAEKG